MMNKSAREDSAIRRNAKSAGAAKDGRCRNWGLVIYPDSAPDRWQHILDDLHIQWVEGPLHDKDVNEGTGELKKPHWHAVLMFDNVKAPAQVKEIADLVHAAYPERINSLRGAIRYLAHLDNPDKAQYDRNGIIPHGGFDVDQYLIATAASRHAMIGEMQSFCRDQGIFDMCDLMDYARDNRSSDWYPLLCDRCTYVMEVYLKSMRGKRSDAKAAADRAAAEFVPGTTPRSARASAGLQPLPPDLDGVSPDLIRLDDGTMADVDPDTGEVVGMILPPIVR